MFSSDPEVYMVVPGSEPIQFDLEKLFLLVISKENFDSRCNHIENTYPIKFQNFENVRFRIVGISRWKYRRFCMDNPMFRSKLQDVGV